MKIPLRLYAASRVVNDMSLDLNSNGVILAEFVNEASCNRADYERRPRRRGEWQKHLQGKSALERMTLQKEDLLNGQGLMVTA